MPRIPALAFLLLAGLAAPAAAIEVCDLPPRYGVGADAAAIVRVACQEHRAWLQAFIEPDGKVGALGLGEAEAWPLDDGQTPAWQRVAAYWRESGTLAAVAGTPGAASCWAVPGNRTIDNDCRAFVLDTPWSAAFISWVMQRARLPGFIGSPRHVDYIARAWRTPASSPYRYEDPFTARPEPGDMLCFLREGTPGNGAQRLRAALAGQGPLPHRSHCEIVVAANPGGDRTLYLVSGNVLNTVAMRKLPLDRTGRLEAARILAGATASAGVPATEDAGAPEPGATVEQDVPLPRPVDYVPGACSPGRAWACDFNRQDWAVLLKLRPQAELDALRGPTATPQATPAAGARP